ncbi:hypothetical protein SAMN05444673_6883 [Bacillus sp. OV166]|nr:hypothetical protein SAMN05444673_6883 [Bacillus sp. OV166]
MLQEHVFFEDTENEITISSTRIVDGILITREMSVAFASEPVLATMPFKTHSKAACLSLPTFLVSNQ